MQFGLSEAIEHWSRFRPNSQAVLFNGHCYTYRELNQRINALCSRLLADGFSGSSIAVAVRSKVDALIAYLAVIRAGHSAVLLNLGLNDESIRTNLSDTKTTEFIHDVHYAKWKSIFSKHPRAIDLTSIDWSKGTDAPDVKESKPCDSWGIFFSSGTTGTPKGIVRSHYSVITELIGWCLELPLTRHTRFYLARPIYYTGGLVLAGGTLLVGGAIILNDYADNNNPDEVWRDYQEVGRQHESIDWAFFVPDQIRAFLKYPRKSIRRVARSILVMGARISGSDKLAAHKHLDAAIVESWGNSESLGTITDPEDLHERADSVGRPFLTDEIRVVTDTEQCAAPFQLGRIVGNEEAGFTEYAGHDRETEQVKAGDMIRSQDYGHLDEAGYLYFRGREAEMLTINEEKCFTGEIEGKLRSVDGIADIAVVPIEVNGSKMPGAVVVVEGNTNNSNGNLLTALNAQLQVHHRLARVCVKDQIPKVAAGKVDIEKCIQMLTEFH